MIEQIVSETHTLWNKADLNRSGCYVLVKLFYNNLDEVEFRRANRRH